MRTLQVFAILLFAFSAAPTLHPAFASDLDAPSTEALAKTQQLLTTPTSRDRAIREEGDKAHKADAFARDIAGSQANHEAMYQVSSQIFAEITQASDGDVDKMQEKLTQAMANPEGFFNGLSETNKKAVRELSEKVPQKQSLH
jgi:hypothetical protein